MGQTQSSYVLPSGKNYKFSYSNTLENVKEIVSLPEKVDLSNLIDFPKEDGNNYMLKLIFTAIYYKVKNLGYDIKNNYYHFIHTYNVDLKTIMENICVRGIKLKENSLSDLKMVPVSYKVTKQNIMQLLCLGNILIGGMVINKKLIDYLDFKSFTDTLLTDIVLILGYNFNSFMILTNWSPDIKVIPFEFIDNFLEIWNIEINCPEDYFLNLNKV